MKTISRNISIALSTLILSGAAVALQKHQSEDYKIIALKDCEIVSEQAMNQDQIDAYLALKDEEVLMHKAEYPIDQIQDSIDELTDKIEDLTERAIQEDGDSVFINKVLLKEQQHVVEQLDDIIDAHQADFDKLEEIGERISAKADVFEDAIEDSLDGIDYNQVQIRTPDSKNSYNSCFNGISKL